MILIELNGERQLVESLDGYDDWTVLDDAERDALLLAAAKDDLWKAVKAKRALVENGSCATPAGAVQCDDGSKIKISGLVTMAMLSLQQAQPFAVDFTMADNSVVTLDAPTAIAMGMAVGQFVAAAHDRGEALRSEIAAADEAALALIDIDSGWPT